MSLEYNSVQHILNNYPLPFNQILLIKEKGRPTPDLDINFKSITKTRTYNGVFNKNIYNKYEWICGCPKINKLFCFYCLIFKKDTRSWTLHGVDDLRHLAERAKRHEESVNHVYACMDFNLFGIVDIREQLKTDYLQNKLKHNENVEKNRHILRRLIMCIKFCGGFELALRGHDEKISFDNPDIYVGLLSFTAELDSVLARHLKNAMNTVFKGTLKTIQNELLDAMFEVYRSELIKEIKTTNFISLEAGETTDFCNQLQMIIIVRYVYNGEIYDRFWSFAKPEGGTADHLANVLLTELQHILTDSSENVKIIAQSYNGAAVMSEKNNSVQAIIRKTFPYAYLVHCYAHQFNLIMVKAAKCHKKIKIFFANLQFFQSFFTRSPKHTVVLDKIVKRKLLQTIPTQWNFKSRIVSTLFEYSDSFEECLETIIDADDLDPKTISEACGLLNDLKCPEFLYWLKLFSMIVPHVEIYLNQIAQIGIDSLELQNAEEQFEQQMIRIKSCITNIVPENQDEPISKKLKTSSAGDTKSIVARDVCDAILSQIKDGFDFQNRLSAAKLFDSKNFKTYRETFPQKYFDDTVTSYPIINSAKLKTELTTIYTRDDICELESVLSLLNFIANNNLKKLLSEIYKLVDIICTTPLCTSTSECETCFSKLKRTKTFLRSTRTEDRLNSLVVLSIEKEYLRSIPDFDNKVIDVFCQSKDRRTGFSYK